MQRYVSSHTLACLTRQGAEELTARLLVATPVRTRRVLVNLTEGKMLVEFEAADRGTLETWFGEQRFHYDWVLRVEWEALEGHLTAV